MIQLNAPPGIDADELRLAQLACAKLAGLVQGAISIGVPAMLGGVPDPRAFFEEQFRVMAGFGIVLQSVSGRPGGQQEVLQLREKSRNLRDALDKLRTQVLLCLDAPHGAGSGLHSARDAAAALCDALGEYAALIKLDPARLTRVRGVVLQVFDGVEKMNPAEASSVP